MNLLTRLTYRLRGTGLSKIPLISTLYKCAYHNLQSGNPYAQKKIRGFEIKLDTRDIGDLTPTILKKGIYDQTMTEVIEEEVKDWMVCVDIGANIGYFTILMAKRAKSVWAYEPEKRNYTLLLENLELNSLANVHAVYGAISNKDGFGTLHVSNTYFGSHSMQQGVADNIFGQESLVVKTYRLDNRIAKPDFIKVDVQGAEMLVLEGMDKILKGSTRIKMVWEFLPEGLKRFGCEPIEFLRKLKGYGFVLQDIDERRGTVSPTSPEILVSKYNGEKGRRFTNLLVTR